MDDQQAKSKWDELARQLGAEILPDSEQLPIPQPVTPLASTDTPSGAAAVAHLAPPKRPAAGWDVLASEFGLPAPTPVAQPDMETAEVRSAAARTTSPDVAAEAREPEAKQRRGRRVGGARGRRDEGKRQRREEGRDRRDDRPPERRDTDLHERRGERSQSRSKQRDEPRRVRTVSDITSARTQSENEATQSPAAEDVAYESVSLPPADEAPPAVEPAKPAAISLWHKIFGLPADHAAAQSPITSAPQVADLTEQELSDSNAVTKAVGEHRGDDTGRSEAEVIETEPERLDELTNDLGDSESQPQRQARRRRRGRGGKGRRGSSERGDSRSRDRRSSDAASADRGGPHDDEAAADDEEFEGIDETATEDEFDDSLSRSAGDEGDDDDAGADHANGGRSRQAMQRSIPSWEEAIGFIVETNMQNRSQRRPSGSSGARAPSSRGRSRGRRKS